MTPEVIELFYDLAFNEENARGGEILDQMRTFQLDDPEKTNGEFSRKCMLEIPKTIPEALFVVFTLGNMNGHTNALEFIKEKETALKN